MQKLGGGIVGFAPTHTQERGSGFHVLQAIAPAMYGQILLCTQAAAAGAMWADTKSTIRHVVVKQVMMELAQATLERQQLRLDRKDRSHIQVADDPYQEVRIATVLRMFGNHINVVAHYEEHLMDSTLYLVQQHCSGGDLHRILSERSSSLMNEPDALRVTAHVASGLAFLHRCGVAHRDVSLENILLHQSGAWKLADFGLAVFIAPSSPSSSMSSPSLRSSAKTECVLKGRVGKPYYMAPEVADATMGSTYDPFAADVWSLGIVLFILLTGSPWVATASLDEKEFRAFSVARRQGISSVLRSRRRRHASPVGLEGPSE